MITSMQLRSSSSCTFTCNPCGPKTAYNPYLQENFKLLGALDFIAELTQHIPARGLRTIRYYGLYSSRSRAKGPQWQHVVAHAPAGWRQGAGLPSDAQAASTDAGTSVPSSRAVHLDRVRSAYVTRHRSGRSARLH